MNISSLFDTSDKMLDKILITFSKLSYNASYITIKHNRLNFCYRR